MGLAAALIVVMGAGLWFWQPSFLARFGLGASQQAAISSRTSAPQRPPAPVEIVQAETGRIADTIEALGTLTANETVAIAPEVAGRIVSLGFIEGRMVDKGQLLVELDAAIARSEVEQARANLALAEDTIDRNRTLVQRGAGTQVSLEQAVAQLAIARANVAASEARLEKLAIHAPFRGVVGLRAVSVGAIVQPGSSIVTLTSVDPIKVDFGMPELFLSAVRLGQSLEIAVDAVPGQTFTGEVYAIDPVVEAAARALRLRATIPNPDNVLKPGLFARVTLTTKVRENAILIPESALVAASSGQGSAVYVVRDGRANLVAVEVGRRARGNVEIVQGIAQGDAVAIAGQLNLRDGAPVLIAPPTAPRTAQGAAR
jgi:membrane fusion protein (multidrug efflux system)